MESQHRVTKSLTWSAVGETAAKLIGPVSTIILARILTPADFGILAICNMVLFFFDIIVDAGFGKYLIQRKFENKEQINRYADVAFWSSITSAFVLWLLICAGRTHVGRFLGNSDYGNVIAVFTIQMILVTAVSVPLSLMRREFQFKKLALFRIITSSIPLLITVPLAYFTRSFWALIIGSFAGHFAQLIMMLLLQKWRPAFYWSKKIFKEMFGFSFWSMCEGLSHWLIFWVDVFILTRLYSDYYVGLYKNSSSLIMSGYLLVATSFVPVLFSALSRIDNSTQAYHLLLNILKLVGILILPITAIILFNEKTITLLLLGKQWLEAGPIIGCWAIIMCSSIIIYSFPAEALKAKGKPMYLFIYQLSYLTFLIPILYFSAQMNFWTFVYSRAYCTLIQFILFLLLAKIILNWRITLFFKALLIPVSVALSIAIVYTICALSAPKYLLDNGYLCLCLGLLIYLCFIIYRRNYIKTTISEIKHLENQ